MSRPKQKAFTRVQVAGAVVLAAMSTAFLLAQAPPGPATPGAPPAGRGPGRGGGGMGGTYNPRPPAAPAEVARGKALYGVQCTFCHGPDARGGESGPNLWRTVTVTNDMKGELIGKVILSGVPEAGMPRFDMTPSQISDIAAFLHSFNVGGRDVMRDAPPNLLVGNAKSGEAYFKAKCGNCHSVTGDLKSIGTRIADPKTLQQTWIMPTPPRGGGFGLGANAALNVPPKTVTVTMPNGQKHEGRLDRIDDFTVTLIDDTGSPRTFLRNDRIPRVEVHDPLKPHKDLLAGYTDDDIHNVTAYLATVK